MKEVKIKYNTVSPRRQEWRDRLQLLGASISITIGYSETFHIYTGIAIILPILGLFIALLNIIFARFYRKLVQQYGDKFELVLLRTSGIAMFITGIGFHISGSKYIQYAYYLLTLLYFIILPYFILPKKKNKLVLILTPSEFIVHKRIRAIKNAWQNIERIWIQKGVIKIEQKGHNNIKQYFIKPIPEEQAAIFEFLEMIKLEKGYGFELLKT